jgi:hypothetical protein
LAESGQSGIERKAEEAAVPRIGMATGTGVKEVGARI